MRTRHLRTILRHATLAVIPLALLNVAFAGKCCQDSSGCSGCLLVSSEPPKYVKIVGNTVQKCADNSIATSCTESASICYSGTNASVYGTGCANVIGTMTVTIHEPQCGGNDDSDDMCSNGG